GVEQRKAVVYFAEIKKGLPINRTNFDRIVAVTAKPDTDDWPGERITLYKDNYFDEKENQAKPCVRVSAIKPPAQGELAAATNNISLPKSLRGDMDDEIPF